MMAVLLWAKKSRTHYVYDPFNYNPMNISKINRFVLQKYLSFF